MYRRIVVAMDGNVASFFALREAIGLATERGAALRAIHVVQSIATLGAEWPNLEAMDDASHREARAILDYALGEARRAGVAAEAALIENERRGISASIVADARHWGADLIVLGAHDHRGIRHLLVRG
jgi:nucleotide-binding universal stress UspA family protein